MPSTFRLNPQFIPKVESAAVRALDDTGREIDRQASANIQPFSSSTARAVNSTRAKVGPHGPEVTVSMGRGLGPIFEFSKQRPRSTSKGENRGVFIRRAFFHRAIDEVIRRGIDLSRYL